MDDSGAVPPGPDDKPDDEKMGKYHKKKGKVKTTKKQKCDEEEGHCMFIFLTNLTMTTHP